ncbi:MAG TPA: ABC transporter permease subunit [Anaerolineae bacterium]
MTLSTRIFKTEHAVRAATSWGDLVVLAALAALMYGGVRLAISAPEVVRGPEISLSPRMLPAYAALSTGRMAAAYILSMIFTLVYGHLAAYHRRAETVMIPVLDVLQSVPILSFLPVVLLSLNAILPQNVAVELASVALIFTSQAWNLTFAWYQSLTTIPKELREADKIFRFNGWLRFKTLELPFATIGLLWNTMMSWAGGWFFLMAAETFTVGQRDFRLPGLGAYLKAAADQGNASAILWGVATLVLVIVLLDQFIWRPLLAWSDRFKVEMIESADPPTSWFYDATQRSRLLDWFNGRVVHPVVERVDTLLLQIFPVKDRQTSPGGSGARGPVAFYVIAGLVGLALLYAAYRALGMLLAVPLAEWGMIGLSLLATLGRVAVSLIIALAWTVPLGVAIGTNRRVATWLQPVVQIVASVPATALFPIFLLALLRLPYGLDLAAILLMLMGTQWYLLFNVIAGAAAIPQDLKYTTALLGLKRGERWRTLTLPALFPYIVTGAITASGGAWNASIVAEYVQFNGQTMQTTGIGATIAQATAGGDYALLLAATLSMVSAVVIINRLLWRRLYRLAELQYRME